MPVKLGIVMPVWIQNQALLDLTYQTMESIRTTADAAMFVICNRLHGILPDDFHKRLEEKSFVPVKLFHEPGVERSVAGAWNHGCRQALSWGSDYLLMMANDILLEPECLDQLISYGEPATTRIALWSGIDTRDRPTIDESLATDGADFSCFMIRPATIDRHGWFDEHFRPAYFEDNDYYARVNLGGDECRVVHAAKFYHHGSMTSRLDAENAHHVAHWFPINRRRFQDKWGTSEPPHTKEEVLAQCHRTPWNDPALSLKDW